MRRILVKRIMVAVAALALAVPAAAAGASGTITGEATGRPSVPPPSPAVLDPTPGQVSQPRKDHFCGTCV
ncbi:hypothetical protein ABNF97_21670 [Plantactinospora sp. B6F1]|uniref:hypothetical protein n=1 Tax=Plantactinospora sp. B6F1 TaxID=3158971 RepID=UPI00102BB042